MNRRGFFLAAGSMGSALVLPYEPKVIYSFATPVPAGEVIASSWRIPGYYMEIKFGQGQVSAGLDHASLAHLVDDDHAQYLGPENLGQGRLYGRYHEHIERVIKAKGFCAWPTDINYFESAKSCLES